MVLGAVGLWGIRNRNSLVPDLEQRSPRRAPPGDSDPAAPGPPWLERKVPGLPPCSGEIVSTRTGARAHALLACAHGRARAHTRTQVHARLQAGSQLTYTLTHPRGRTRTPSCLRPPAPRRPGPRHACGSFLCRRPQPKAPSHGTVPLVQEGRSVLPEPGQPLPHPVTHNWLDAGRLES